MVFTPPCSGPPFARARRVASQLRAGRVVINGNDGRSPGALGRFQIFRDRPRIRAAYGISAFVGKRGAILEVTA